MLRIVADNKIPFLQGALEPWASVSYMDGRAIRREDLLEADALVIRTRTRCDRDLLHGTPVKFIATATIGHDHIDAAYCASRDIRWINAPGCNAASVQQYIASVLAVLALRHGLPFAGTTIGIVGAGHVGTKVAALARTLGMHVLLNDPPRERAEGGTGFVTLETVLRDSDIVSLHVPLNREGEDATLRMIDRGALRKMKQNAWLFNTSRGEVVDGEALKEALTGGSLAGAVLDVWEHEPAVDPRLLDQVAIATPHIAGYSTDGKRNGTVQVVRGAGEFFGLPLDAWEPGDLPVPERSVINLDAKGMPRDHQVAHAILGAYDVRRDDIRFRTDPGSFEQQRGDYPVRREFPAYGVNLLNPLPGMESTLSELGFRVALRNETE